MRTNTNNTDKAVNGYQKKKTVSKENDHKSDSAGVEYNASFEWDDEASVWVVTSYDIQGLALEDESMDELIHRIQKAVPELLELNGQRPASRIKCSVKARRMVYV